MNQTQSSLWDLQVNDITYSRLVTETVDIECFVMCRENNLLFQLD
jgi:hypothetical protein